MPFSSHRHADRQEQEVNPAANETTFSFSKLHESIRKSLRVWGRAAPRRYERQLSNSEMIEVKSDMHWGGLYWYLPYLRLFCLQLLLPFLGGQIEIAIRRCSALEGVPSAMGAALRWCQSRPSQGETIRQSVIFQRWPANFEESICENQQ